jgi:uncharacterized membrane protein YjjP (DUF1212 family)
VDQVHHEATRTKYSKTMTKKNILPVLISSLVGFIIILIYMYYSNGQALSLFSIIAAFSITIIAQGLIWIINRLIAKRKI